AQADVLIAVTVLGAGMAGLAAAARLREFGASPVVLEKGTRPGGSMLLSSCVVWRFRDWEEYRAECPAGAERLQRLVWERLDEASEWLVARGPPVVGDRSGDARAVGRRSEPQALRDALVRMPRGSRVGL